MSAYLELKGVSKFFGDFVANDRIDLSVEKGSIHAIVGENGAGKSTLMNILSGIYRPDEGEILIDGQARHFSSPIAASRTGIGMVYQEFMLFPELSVLDNIIMGYEQTSCPGVVDRKRSRAAVEAICQEYGFNIPLTSRVSLLPVAMLQQIEIVKVLYRGADIIIFDEPTSVLTPQGIVGLFKAFRALTEKGKTILFITHKLQEVLSIADDITVLKNGRITSRTKPGQTSETELARAMVGREVMLHAAKLDKTPGEVLLDVQDLVVLGSDGRAKVKNVDLQIHSGEIVGIAGVAGSGENELSSALVGLTPVNSGSIRFCGEAIEHLSCRERRRCGIGYVPQDRNAEGVNRGASLWENCMMGYHVAHPFRHKWLIDRKNIESFTGRVMAEYQVKAGSMYAPVASLSGGNVQKLIVGREFLQDYKLLIIEDPTRGIDIGAIEFIWKKIEELAAAGAAILLVSHELNEVMEVSDRILVMNSGKLLPAGVHGEKTEEQIGMLMLGGQEP